MGLTVPNVKMNGVDDSKIIKPRRELTDEELDRIIANRYTSNPNDPFYFCHEYYSIKIEHKFWKQQDLGKLKSMVEIAKKLDARKIYRDCIRRGVETTIKHAKKMHEELLEVTRVMEMINLTNYINYTRENNGKDKVKP